MTNMNSRERVLAALNHHEPDRVPIDIGGLGMFSCWHEEAQAKVKEYLGFQGGETIINSVFSRTVRPDPRIRDRFQTDCFGLVSSPPSTWQLEIHTEEDGGAWFYDEWQCKWRCPAGGHYFDVIEHPLADATVADVARYPWPDGSDPARLDGVVELAKDLYENTDYCLCYTPVWATGVFLISALLQGWENHFVNLLIDKKLTRAIYDATVEFHLAQWDLALDKIGDYIQVGVLSDDLGFQDQPMIRLEVFREMVKPAYKTIIDFIKSKKPDLKLVFHSDGAIYQFLPEFVELGLDATNPVQISCAGMGDTAKLKREFGDKLTFWGAGVDTQSTLPYGTVEEVRAEVKRRIQDLAPGGGYIFSPVHNVQFDVPVENVIACYDAALEFRAYPVQSEKQQL